MTERMGSPSTSGDVAGFINLTSSGRITMVYKKIPLLKPLKGGEAKFEVVEGGFVIGHYVPKGLVTDLDSVPRIPLVYALFKSRSTLAALLHDHLYKTGMYSRKEADDAFYAAMIWEGVEPWAALVIHRAVRIFGRTSYKNRVGGEQ